MTSSPAPPTDSRFEKLRTGAPLEFPGRPEGREETPAEKATRTIPAHWLERLVEGHKRTVSVPIKIVNAIIDGPLDLQHTFFECNLLITDSEFTGPVDFAFATFQHETNFERSRFLQPVHFRAVRCHADLEVSGAHFGDAVRFQDLHVDEVFGAAGTNFAKADFQRIQVGKDLFFRTDGQGRPATFRGVAIFSGAHIVGDANFSGVQFETSAAFQSFKVEGDAFFTTDEHGHRVTFGGDAQFNSAQIIGNTTFSGAEFRGEAHFDAFQFGAPVRFRPDRSGQSVTFAKMASFPSAEFNSDAQFDKAAFDGGVDFDNARFGGAARFTEAEVAEGKKATFIGVHFERGARFSGTKLSSDVDFTAAVAQRDLWFDGAKFSGLVSFREASLHSLFFDEPAKEGQKRRRIFPSKETRPPKATKWGGAADLRGLTYERIYVYLPDLFSRLTPFDRQPYSQLEGALRRVGADQRAQTVYLERRHAERRHKFRRGRFPAWCLDWIYRVSVNYGLAPVRLIFLALLLIFLGAFLFEQPGALEPAKKDANQALVKCSHVGPADGLAVSVHYFLPMDSPIGEDCKPVSDRILTTAHVGKWNHQFVFWPSPSWYATVCLRVAGAILVGIGLAAVTGLLRRIAQ